jgi:hypothetical protein
MDREKKQFAWWYYFWLLVVLSAVSPIFHEGLEDWLYWLLGLIPLAGLWGYLRRKPLGHRYFWMGYLVFAVLSLLYAATSLSQAPSNWRFAVALIFISCTAVIFPLLLALWLYSFRSPDIWRRTVDAT